jgi:hypothetical protein
MSSVFTKPFRREASQWLEGTTFRYVPNQLERYVAVYHEGAVLSVFPRSADGVKATYPTLDAWVSSLSKKLGVPLTVKDISVTHCAANAPLRAGYVFPERNGMYASSIEFMSWLYSVLDEHATALLDSDKMRTAFNELSAALDKAADALYLSYPRDSKVFNLKPDANSSMSADVCFNTNTGHSYDCIMWDIWRPRGHKAWNLVEAVKEKWDTVVWLMSFPCEKKFRALLDASAKRRKLARAVKSEAREVDKLAILNAWRSSIRPSVWAEEERKVKKRIEKLRKTQETIRKELLAIKN